VNITNSSTNKAFQVLVDPSRLVSPFNSCYELFAPCHVLLSPESCIHTQIEPVDLEFLVSVGQCFQNPCQRAVTKLICLVEPHNLSFIVVDWEHDCSRILNDEWSRFVTIVKQQHKLDEVSYHKLFDILKQYQKKVNELCAERLARNANPLALVATAQANRDKASDYDNSDLVPQIQHVFPSVDTTVSSQQELDILFGPSYDEFFNAGTSSVNKSSSPIDNSKQRDIPPTTNIQSSIEPSNPTNTNAEENNDNQAEHEFTNPFCTPVQEVSESSPTNVAIDDSDRVLFNCQKVKSIWLKCFDWWNFSIAAHPSSIVSLVSLFVSRNNKWLAKICHGISLVVLWAIWRWCNHIVHRVSDSRQTVIDEDIFSQIKILSLLWISNRSTWVSCPWEFVKGSNECTDDVNRLGMRVRGKRTNRLADFSQVSRRGITEVAAEECSFVCLVPGTYILLIKVAWSGCKYLMLAVQELVSGHQCEGRFVFGCGNKKPKESPENDSFTRDGTNPKSLLQTLLTRAGHTLPKYKIKHLETNEFRALVGLICRKTKEKQTACRNRDARIEFAPD
nr:RNA-directed DNA polymerase, eukaryota, reverse transcriptase zinc-binding domain protein [Tanacetum cinerariifolium]